MVGRGNRSQKRGDGPDAADCEGGGYPKPEWQSGFGNDAARDLKGRLAPFGWIKLLWRLKLQKIRRARVPLMGVRRAAASALGNIRTASADATAALESAAADLDDESLARAARGSLDRLEKRDESIKAGARPGK